MAQSRKGSAVEAATNVLFGFVIALTVQVIIFPFYDLQASAGEHFQITCIFMVVSFIRAFWLRRMFIWLRSQGIIK